MEIEGSDGSETYLEPGSKLEWGRDSGFRTEDRTVSRRHVEFHLRLSDDGESRVRFLVHGKNPMWVHRSNSGEVSTFKTSESGEMEIGDAFCVSAKNPIWFTCKKCELDAGKSDNGRGEVGLEGEFAESLSAGVEVEVLDSLELESVDISHIDPVKDFGFLVIGEEFKSYPKRMIKDIKKWDWFLDDDEIGENKRKKRGGRSRKRKKGGGEEDDEDWTGESEGEEMVDELISNKEGKVQKTPKYSTRSKGSHDLPAKDAAGKNKNAAGSTRKKAAANADVGEDEDEEDETLGGFIVDDEDLEEDVLGKEELDEEEEEFDEDEELDD